MLKSLFIVFLLLKCGCTSTVPEFPNISPKCRHLAPFSALTWQNMTDEETVILIGPSKADPKVWHAQAAVFDSDYVVLRWLVWNGKTWTIGKRKAFHPKDFIIVEAFFNETLNGEYGGAGFKNNKQ